jgi:hypothetical protein
VSIFSQPVSLDTFVVKSGFDVNAFIRRVRTDTTFYKAFRSIHLVPYNAVNDIRAYDKTGKIIASEFTRTKQKVINHCRSMEVLERKTTGDFYRRNGNYNYYTAELFAHLFYTKDSVCNENDIVAGALTENGASQIEKRSYQLKQLIFNPGTKVSGIPFVSDRASIFDPEEAEKYNFKIEQAEYEGQKCYVFSIMPKTAYLHKVIYDELITWFRKSDYSIVARNYALSYNTLIYDFSVKMQVRTRQINGKLYPVFVSYDGDWHIFGKKRERVRFTTDLNF